MWVKVTEKLIWSTFGTLVGVFLVIASVVFIPAVRELLMSFWFITISGVVFFLLGVALIFLTVKGRVRRMAKKFLILTGASSAGLFVSVFSHNIIYGLFIDWFGADFWHRIAPGDELFFFVVAISICLTGFLVGAVGIMILVIKQPK